MLHVKMQCKNLVGETLVVSRKTGGDPAKAGFRKLNNPLHYVLNAEQAFSRLIIFLIKIYQNTLRFLFPPSCRFHPSCSEYAVQAIQKFGFIKGGWFSIKRLSRCHPFNPGGFDPIP